MRDGFFCVVLLNSVQGVLQDVDYRTVILVPPNLTREGLLGRSTNGAGDSAVLIIEEVQDTLFNSRKYFHLSLLHLMREVRLYLG